MGSSDALRRENEALRDRISRLNEAILRINGSLDLSTVLREVVDSARALTGAQYGVITTLDAGKQVPDFVSSGFTPDEHRQLTDWHLHCARRHRWCPRPDQQPLSGYVGRDVLAGACVPNPGAAGAVPVRVRSRSSAGLRWTRGRLWHPRRQHRPLRTGLGSGDRCKGRRFAARRMYVPGILSSQPSQVCLPSHGTVPERRANVQKGARPRGTDRRCSVPFRGSAGRRKDAGTRWLGCCPPERSTGETHPRAKRPMNRAKLL